MKALAKNAGARYPTALALQAELEAYMAERKLGASPREISAFVSELYADQRQETKRALEEKLSREGSLNWGDSVPISIASSASVSQQTKTLLAPSRRSSWDILIWTLGVSALGGLLLFFISLRSHEAKPAAALQALAASSSIRVESAAPAPTLVSVRISASPNFSEILVDEKPVAGNPVQLAVTNDGKVHTVKVLALDHKPRSVSVKYDRDQDIVVALERTAAASNPVQRAQQKAPLPTVSAAPSLPPQDCEPPVYVDERGIKHVKAGCLR